MVQRNKRVSVCACMRAWRVRACFCVCALWFLYISFTGAWQARIFLQNKCLPQWQSYYFNPQKSSDASEGPCKYKVTRLTFLCEFPTSRATLKERFNALLTCILIQPYNKYQQDALYVYTSNIFQDLTSICFEQIYCSASEGTILYIRGRTQK
jgi:hypothetical protein